MRLSAGSLGSFPGDASELWGVKLSACKGETGGLFEAVAREACLDFSCSFFSREPRSVLGSSSFNTPLVMCKYMSLIARNHARHCETYLTGAAAAPCGQGDSRGLQCILPYEWATSQRRVHSRERSWMLEIPLGRAALLLDLGKGAVGLVSGAICTGGELAVALDFFLPAHVASLLFSHHVSRRRAFRCISATADVAQWVVGRYLPWRCGVALRRWNLPRAAGHRKTCGQSCRACAPCWACHPGCRSQKFAAAGSSMAGQSRASGSPCGPWRRLGGGEESWGHNSRLESEAGEAAMTPELSVKRAVAMG